MSDTSIRSTAIATTVSLAPYDRITLPLLTSFALYHSLISKDYTRCKAPVHASLFSYMKLHIVQYSWHFIRNAVAHRRHYKEEVIVDCIYDHMRRVHHSFWPMGHIWWRHFSKYPEKHRLWWQRSNCVVIRSMCAQWDGILKSSLAPSAIRYPSVLKNW